MKASEYKKLLDPTSGCAVLIGIDAGKHTGVAIGSAEDPTIEIDFHTFDFWEAFDFIKGYPTDYTGIIIEVPNSKRPMYNRVDGNSNAGRVRELMSSRIGGNRREAELLADGLERLGYPVQRVTPTKKKWNAEDLARETGITKRTNEHVRDAIRLVWDKVR